MRLRLLSFGFLFCSLSPVGAQQVDIMPSDSLMQADSLISLDIVVPEEELQQEKDSVESGNVVLNDSDTVIPAELPFWFKPFPLVEPSEAAMKAAAADMGHPSELLQRVDTMPVDPSLCYAQNDLRLPVVMDGKVPGRELQIWESQDNAPAYLEPLGLPARNVFQRQLTYADIRSHAVFSFASQNKKKVSMFRPDVYDLPTDRKRIERQELTGDEQVETGLGLELETVGLNVEQVTFHADKWHRRGTTDLQISQTALSDNWYKGGENNLIISNYDKLAFSRYDESMKTTLDITLELRLSGYYTKADTVHSMRVYDNQFRADVSYGYKAWKNWYYSTSAYLKTPVFEYFNANSSVVKNNFFSPMELNVAVGMDLKQAQKKNYSYSLMFAPLSYNVKYVSDDRVSVTSFGIDQGKRSLHQFGSSITGKLEWKISDIVNWTSRAYFFTSYHNTLLEFENTINLVLSRYSSAKIYLYPRFDDSSDDRIQMKEMLTFGLAFAW